MWGLFKARMPVTGFTGRYRFRQKTYYMAGHSAVLKDRLWSWPPTKTLDGQLLFGEFKEFFSGKCGGVFIS
jgi:hypothetical protein